MPVQDLKKLIEAFYPEFITFFFSDFSSYVDFQRNPAFLNVSTAAATTVVPFSFLLIGIRLKDGNATLLLFVLEQQGYDNATFGQQLFRTYAKVLEEYDYKFQGAVFVLFLGNSLPKDVERYEHQHFHTNLALQFGRYIVREQYLEDLWQLHNPFAYIIAAQRLKQEHQHSPKFLLESKLILLEKIIDFYKTNTISLDKLALIKPLTLDALILPATWNKEFEESALIWLNTKSGLLGEEKKRLVEQLWVAS